MPFPIHRPRRLRKNPAILRMVRETTLSSDDLIHPIFVCEGKGRKEAISSMPGVFRQSIDHAVADARETHRLNIPAVILFGIPDQKDARGSEAYNPDGVVQRAIREIKSAVPELGGFSPAVRRPQIIPDGSGQRDRGPEGGVGRY